MRFNDMIATVLAAADQRPEAKVAQWRQLVDLLAQRQVGAPGAAREGGFAFLRANRDAIEPKLRAETAASLSGLAVDPELLVFFAEDRADIAAPLLRTARLVRAEWLAVLPRLGPSARALLRHRGDLPDEVRLALRAFGPADLVLGPGEASPQPEGEARPAASEGSQIRDLVNRIEAYQRRRREPTAPIANAGGERPALRWEAGPDGLIRWTDADARGGFIGASVAAPARAGETGVDQIAAAAFARRAPFGDARLTIGGGSQLAGEWRMSGVPCFDPIGGRLTGYRGSARRVRAEEADSAAEAPLFGPSLPPDSLRQLVHELRTPINAIMGFADMIEGEYLGPASTRYRERASDIADQARQLLFAVDDLDTAARIESRRLDVATGEVDLGALLGELHESYDRTARRRGATLNLKKASDKTDVAVARDLAERMLSRLLAATVGVVGPGEIITIALEPTRHEARDTLCVAIDRPRVVAGLDESALLDPVYIPAGDWPDAPGISLGFALRLVRDLANAAGGALAIDPERVRLYLPLAPAELILDEGAR